MLEAKFVMSSKSFKSHRAVPIKVVLTNTSADDLHVLTWGTPLDTIVTDCLEITVDRKKVEYDGPIIKRAAPSAKDYVLIKAGESIEAKFMVSNAYNTSRPGKYKVKLKSPILDVRPKSVKLAAALSASDFTPTPRAIADQTNFVVEPGDGERLTLGAAARSKEAAKKSAKAVKAPTGVKIKKKPLAVAAASATPSPLPPTIRGGSAVQKTAARVAHTNGYNLSVAALASLTNNARYKEWFGVHTTARFNKVKKNYNAVKTRIETIPFTYDLSLSGCDSGVYAYTYKGTSTIWFCDQFWAAPATGTDSKAGTVLHEHTHSDALTDDNVYGQSGCRALAISDPGKAVANADSHEYFAGG